MKLYTINATPLRGNEDEQARIEKLTSYEGTVARILARNDINGFTIYQVQGYWKGDAEQSFKIEIATSNPILVADACAQLRDMYNQDAVMLTNPDNTVEFI